MGPNGMVAVEHIPGFARPEMRDESVPYGPRGRSIPPPARKATMEDAAVLVLRLTLGSVFLAHGWPKVFGQPDGVHGRGRTSRLLTSKGLPMPQVLAWGVGISEIVGGALVVVGLFTRLAIIPLAVILSGAVVVVKWNKGFEDGWDWPFSLLGICVALFLLGGGTWSLDDLLGLSI